MKKNNIHIYTIIFGTVTIFFGYVVIVWTIIPYMQIGKYYNLVREMKVHSLKTLERNDFTFSPYTYVQRELRMKLLFSLFEEYKDQEVPQDAVFFAIQELEEVLSKEKPSAKFSLALGRGYSFLARKNPDQKIYTDKAEENYKTALLLWPHSQEVIFEYALILIRQGKAADAEALVRSEIALAPKVIELRNYLGYALYEKGQAYYAESLDTFETVLQAGKVTDEALTKNIYTQFFAYFYKKNDIPHFMTVVQRLYEIDAERRGLYDQIITYISKTNTLPRIEIK